MTSVSTNPSRRGPGRVVPRPLLALLLAGLSACAGPRRSDFEVPAPPTPLRIRAEAPACTPPPGPLTAEGAAVLALARNPDVASARARLDGARAGLEQARAALAPVVGVDATILGGDAPSAYLFKRIDARNLAPNTNFNRPGAFWNFEAGATLRYNVWDGGRSRLGVWAAEAGVDAARSEREVVANTLVAAVLSTYLGVRATNELLAATDASVRTVEAQVAETRARVEGGGALRSDLLSLEVRLAEAQERRIRTDVARRLALATLRHLLALPPDAPLALSDVPFEAGEPPATKEEGLVEAYRGRPEMKAVRQAVRAARIGLERARRAGLPSVDLQARYYGDDEGLSLDRNWTVAVALSWDLYDGGRRRAQVHEARAVLDQLEERDRKALIDVALDVETSYLALEEARARLDVASKAVGAADETLDLVEAQYRGGSAPVTRYLETEAARTGARTNRIRAALDVDRAVVDVHRALGRLGRECWR